MNIQEMHIEVEQSTNNIGGKVRRKLLPEQIDWVLNKTMDRMVHSCLLKQEDGSYKLLDYDKLRTLLKTAVQTAEKVSDTEMQVHLPCDYKYLVSDTSRITCSTPNLDQQEKVYTALQLPVITGTPPFFTGVGTNYITIGDESLELTDILRDGYNITSWPGVNSVQEAYVVRNFWMDYLWRKGYKAHWEYFRDFYQRNSIIIEATEDECPTLSFNGEPADKKSYKYICNTYETAGDFRPNRLTPPHKIHDFNSTGFLKTNSISPLSLLDNHFLKVYTTESFIVTEVKLFYIKRYRRMNLSLGGDCELPEGYHQALCDLASEYFTAMFRDPEWEIKLKDNMTREPLTV